jgi:hypothetical protein
LTKARFGQLGLAQTYLTHNLGYTGSAWNLDDTSVPGVAVGFLPNFPIIAYAASAGANPRTLAGIFNINTQGQVFEQGFGANMGGWLSYSPGTNGSITIGNGSISGAFARVDKTIDFTVGVVFGSTTVVNGPMQITVPVGYAAASASMHFGRVVMYSAAGQYYQGWLLITGTGIICGIMCAAGAGPSPAASVNTPFVWSNGAQFWVAGSYRAS